MLKVLLRPLFLVLITSNLFCQNDSEKILFVGHAYGSHSVDDKTLDPLFLEFNSKYGFNYDEIVLGGDFIYNCDDNIEYENFIQFYNLYKPKLIIGGHDNCEKIFKLFPNENLNFHKKINDTLMFYINTSVDSNQEVINVYNYIDQTIESENVKDIIIFTHQLIFSKSDWNIRVNSRGYYNYGNLLYDKIYSKYYNSQLNFYFISGDIGAFKFTPYAYYDKLNNFNLIASGLGNGYNYMGILIDIADNVKIEFINIKSNKIENIKKYSKYLVQLYQFPKLILSKLKDIIYNL